MSFDDYQESMNKKRARSVSDFLWAVVGFMLLVGAVAAPQDPCVNIVADVFSRAVVIAVAAVCMWGFIPERK